MNYYLCVSYLRTYYNSALYAVRQHYFNTKKYLNVYENINNFTKNKQEDYVKLPAKVSQQIMMLVDQNFKSFFGALKSKRNGTNDRKIKIPHYLDKNGKYVLIYTSQAISSKELKNGIVKLPKFNIRIKTDKTNIKQVRIIPKNNFYVIEIVYDVKEKDLLLDNNRFCSIDLGVNNLATIGSNVLKPLIINGRPLKSINQFYNKQNAEIKSKLELKSKQKTSNKLKSLNQKRNNKVKDYLHKASRLVINHLVSNSINTLIIGKNKEWKQEVNIGKKNNQNFVQIPHSIFINMLSYKAKLLGINVLVKEESYTSKCSFLDNELIKKHETYLGKRIKRGLFKSSEGKLINADLNGALNILRKVVPSAIK
ncbi:MAG: transposase, partial [Clostridia bacterium]